MATNLPLDPHHAVRQAADADRERNAFPWGQLGVFLIILGIFGWSFYHFYWQYRLPQERVLVDNSGKEMEVRIELRRGDLLKLVQIKDGSSQWFPIAMLSDRDQVFARAISADSPLSFPLAYTLKDPEGNPQAVTLKGHNDFILEYSLNADLSQHYIAINVLPDFDRAMVGAMINGLSISYPFEYTLVDAKGKLTPVRVLGRSEYLLKYSTSVDEKVILQRLSSLSAVDQSAMNSLPYGDLSVTYPVDYSLISETGASIPVRLLGRSEKIVSYEDVGGTGEAHIKLLKELSGADRVALETLSTTAQTTYPIDWVLTNKSGKHLVVRLINRSGELVQYKLANEDDPHYDHYYPIASMSTEDQEYIRQLPISGAELKYPFDCYLTDRYDRILKVNVVGRTKDSVKFTTQVDNKTHDYVLTDLSDMDQAFLITLPRNLLDESDLPSMPSYVQTMRIQMIELEQHYVELNNELLNPGLFSTQTNDIMREMGDIATQVTHDVSEITNNFAPRIAVLEKEDVELDGKLLSSTLSAEQKSAIKNQIDHNVDTITALNNELKNITAIGDLVKKPNQTQTLDSSKATVPNPHLGK